LHQTSVFTVDLNNQPGELARLCEAMAGAGVNLVLSATIRGEGDTVVFIADDKASAETVIGRRPWRWPGSGHLRPATAPIRRRPDNLPHSLDRGQIGGTRLVTQRARRPADAGR
jgi:hypothetical protein